MFHVSASSKTNSLFVAFNGCDVFTPIHGRVNHDTQRFVRYKGVFMGAGSSIQNSAYAPGTMMHSTALDVIMTAVFGSFLTIWSLKFSS